MDFEILGLNERADLHCPQYEKGEKKNEPVCDNEHVRPTY